MQEESPESSEELPCAEAVGRELSLFSHFQSLAGMLKASGFVEKPPLLLNRIRRIRMILGRMIWILLKLSKYIKKNLDSYCFL
jgi:hypothetical protein